MKKPKEGMRKNKIDLMAIKVALNDSRFRKTLPDSFEEGVNKFLNNPTCPCNVPLYRKILRDCRLQLTKYFPNREVIEESQEISKLAKNHWTVINCAAIELQKKLKDLGSGRKQLAVARYGDQVTVIVNDLDYIF